MNSKTKTNHISIRTDDDFKIRLLAAAEKEGRSHTNLALHAIKLYLDQYHPEIKPPEPDPLAPTSQTH